MLTLKNVYLNWAILATSDMSLGELSSSLKAFEKKILCSTEVL